MSKLGYADDVSSVTAKSSARPPSISTGRQAEKVGASYEQGLKAEARKYAVFQAVVTMLEDCPDVSESPACLPYD